MASARFAAQHSTHFRHQVICRSDNAAAVHKHRDLINSQWSGAAGHPMALFRSQLNRLLDEEAARQTALIVDVGANEGQMLTPPHLQFAPLNGTSVVLIEARNLLAAKLGETAQRLRHREWADIRVHHVALSRAPGSNVTFHYNRKLDFGPWTGQQGSLAEHGDEMPSRCRGRCRAFGTRTAEQVRVSTLDIELGTSGPAIDYLKVDAEGFDSWVLMGGAAVLRRTRLLLFEINYKMRHKPPGSTVYEMQAFLATLGFSTFVLDANGTESVLRPICARHHRTPKLPLPCLTCARPRWQPVAFTIRSLSVSWLAPMRLRQGYTSMVRMRLATSDELREPCDDG